MVAQHTSPCQGAPPPGTSLAPSDHGCQPQGLGSSSGPPLSSRDLVKDRSSPSHQHPGDPGSPSGSIALATPSSGTGHQGTIRQCHHGYLPKSSRRNPKPSSSQGGQPYSDLGGGPGLPADSSLHPGSRELAGRLPQPAAARPRRVGPKSKYLSGHRRSMGSPERRPHGISSEPASPSIHGQVPRPSSSGSGCSHGQLGLPSGLRIPPASSSAQSHQEDQGRFQPGDPSGPLLAQKGLVLRAGSSQQGRTLEPSPGSRPSLPRPDPPPGPGIPEFDGLALESLVLQRKGFSPEVIRTMMAARRPVSSRTYHRVWRIFKDWCDTEGYSFQTFSLPRLLSFLQSGLSKGLSLGSLKSQISALSVLFQRRLATLPDIATFLQGVSRLRPPFRDPIPPWDLNLVLTVLQGPPFEPLGSIPLAWLTWKTVFLLAISSARRVSEISALSHLQPYLVFHEDRAVLRTLPSFVPKVGSSFHINQDITIPSFCSKPSSPKEVALHALDPVRALKFYLHRTKDIRQSSALFIVPAGPQKGFPASKATLSRWIREAIRRAYIARGKQPPLHLKAHSTRGISTSWAFRNRASAEQVCRAATWSSIHSFTKFYRFEIFAASDAHFGRKVLQAAVT
uniref:Tyr recombinase domain-containing protein n=1 Tax=Xenopus tropicalis TaxID=8364 RepID=A0A803JI75_XENTR